MKKMGLWEVRKMECFDLLLLIQLLHLSNRLIDTLSCDAERRLTDVLVSSNFNLSINCSSLKAQL